FPADFPPPRATPAAEVPGGVLPNARSEGEISCKIPAEAPCATRRARTRPPTTPKTALRIFHRRNAARNRHRELQCRAPREFSEKRRALPAARTAPRSLL